MGDDFWYVFFDFGFFGCLCMVCEFDFGFDLLVFFFVECLSGCGFGLFCGILFCI